VKIADLQGLYAGKEELCQVSRKCSTSDMCCTLQKGIRSFETAEKQVLPFAMLSF